MTAIRVLRVIEYTYQTPERMFEDMQGWSDGCHAWGTGDKRVVMQSVVVSRSIADPEVPE